MGSETPEETLTASDFDTVRDSSETIESKRIIKDIIPEEDEEEPEEVPEVKPKQKSETKAKVIEEKEEVIEQLAEETEPSPPSNPTITVQATYYVATCEGCSGITKTGVDVRSSIYYEGKRIIAVDPNVIPLGSTVIVRTDSGESFEATAQDIGSAIQGNRIDILVESESEAYRLGRVSAEVEIIN